MARLTADNSALVLIDFQARLIPAILDGEAVAARAQKLLSGAGILEVPVTFTEQLPDKLGSTLDALKPRPVDKLIVKSTFNACQSQAFLSALPGDRTLVVAGCEAHVCVLQTVLGLLDAGRKVALVEDAVGSRFASDRSAALSRMKAHGADIVTSEMVLFEWLGDADNLRFREVLALIK